MPKYTVLEPLGYDRRDPYMPGDIVEMEEAEASGLIQTGVLGATLVEKTTSIAAEAIAKAREAASIEALDALAAGEIRVTVLAAIEARRKELEA